LVHRARSWYGPWLDRCRCTRDTRSRGNRRVGGMHHCVWKSVKSYSRSPVPGERTNYGSERNAVPGDVYGFSFDVLYGYAALCVCACVCMVRGIRESRKAGQDGRTAQPSQQPPCQHRATPEPTQTHAARGAAHTPHRTRHTAHVTHEYCWRIN
jgi:hypothetical protein